MFPPKREKTLTSDEKVMAWMIAGADTADTEVSEAQPSNVSVSDKSKFPVYPQIAFASNEAAEVDTSLVAASEGDHAGHPSMLDTSAVWSRKEPKYTQEEIWAMEKSLFEASVHPVKQRFSLAPGFTRKRQVRTFDYDPAHLSQVAAATAEAAFADAPLAEVGRPILSSDAWSLNKDLGALIKVEKLPKALEQARSIIFNAMPTLRKVSAEFDNLVLNRMRPNGVNERPWTIFTFARKIRAFTTFFADDVRDSIMDEVDQVMVSEEAGDLVADIWHWRSLNENWLAQKELEGDKEVRDIGLAMEELLNVSTKIFLRKIVSEQIDARLNKK